MEKRPVPSWVKHVWDELTKPPAIFHNQPSRQRDRDSLQDEETSDEEQEEGDEETDASVRSQRANRSAPTGARRSFSLQDLFDSPTDPPLTPRTPRASARTATRVAQKYFVPKRTQRKPSTKPRPRTRPRRQAKPQAPTRMQTDGVASLSARNARPLASTALRSSASGSTARSVATLPQSVQTATEQMSDALQCRIVETEIVDSVWRITTDHAQVYALKETTLPLSRLRFMADALDEVYQSGFTHVARMIRRRSGDPYLQDAGHVYILSEWLPGHRAQFGSTRQVGAVARATARFHDVSRRFTPKGDEPPSAFAVFDHLVMRKQDLMHIQSQLEQSAELDEFDQWALRQLPKANQQAADALALIKLPETERDLALAVQNPGLCHLDVTRQNMIMHPSGYAQLIDFDHTAFGPRTLDLAHLIRRAMQAHGTWTSEIAIAPLLAYNRVRPLSQGEYLLLEALLVFPHRLWRLLRTHYDSEAKDAGKARKDLELLREAAALDEERERFLITFAKQVTRRAEA